MFYWEDVEGKNCVWNQRRDEPSPRNLKRVRYFDGSPSKPETESDDGVKKMKKMVDDKVGPALALADVYEEGPSTIKACNQSQNFDKDPFGPWVSEGMQEGETLSSDEQKTLHISLRVEMTKLCHVLKFSGAVKDIALRILDYVIKNRDVNSRSQSVVHALQISLCWIAASITKTNIDKKDSLMLAKQLLYYQCTEEQAHSVYLILKEMYPQCPEKIVDSGRYCSLAEEGTLKEKAAATDTDSGIMKLKKNVKKRMKRLVQKHQEQRQELIRSWEEERVKLVMRHKVESAFIRSVHGQSSVGMDKLKILNNDLDAKTSELNLQKGVELKNLETRQSADIAEEERKTAQWLAEAKAYSSRLETVNELESVGPQPKEQVVEGPQPSETHVKNSATVGSQNDGVLPMAEHVNKLKNSSNDDEDILANPPGFVEPVPDEVERNTSEKVSDKGCKSSSPDDVVSSCDSECPNQPSLRSEQTPDCCDLSPPKVLDELAVEKPSNLHTEAETIGTSCPEPSNNEAPVVTKETVTPGLSSNEASVTDANVTQLLSNNGSLVTEKIVTLVQSINEASVTEKTLTSVPSNREVPVTQNSGLLSCNTSPTTEENYQERRSPQTAERRGAEVLSHESTPQTRENLDVHINHPNNTEPVISAAQGQSAELSAPSQNVVAVQSQVVMCTDEHPNQVVLQPEIDPNSFLLPSYQPTSGSLHPSLLADPLKIELDNLRREAEQMEINQKNLISQLSSDCHKEIQETVAQTRKKYELKFQECDAEYQLKKQELDKNQKKVLMNKILAAAFRSTCSDPALARVPVMQQVAPSCFAQQAHQRSMLPSAGPPPGLSPSQSTATCPITAPSVLTMQQQQKHLPRAHPLTTSPTFINQNIPTVRSPTFVNQSVAAVRPPTTINRHVPSPPLQAVQNMAALFSRIPPPPRPPPLIGTITPSCNPRPGGEIRSAAPHLQSFRPAATSAPAPHLRAPHRLLSQALPLPPLTNLSVSQIRAAVLPQAPPTNIRPYVPAAESRSREICSTFGSLEPSDVVTPGNNVPPGNVFCLSDDD